MGVVQGVVVLVEHLVTQPTQRLEPDGVRHSAPPLGPDPRRAAEDPAGQRDPQPGEKSHNSQALAHARLRPPPEDTPPPHRRLAPRETAASNPSTRRIV